MDFTLEDFALDIHREGHKLTGNYHMNNKDESIILQNVDISCR